MGDVPVPGPSSTSSITIGDRVITKRLANSKKPEKKPTPEEFVQEGVWVAVWVDRDPNEVYNEEAVWTSDPLFKYLRPVLERIGWTDTDFKVPKPGKRCEYSSGSGSNFARCGAMNKGHHGRHMLSHLPQGIGYFQVCPICKSITRRVDNMSRHSRKCPANRTSTSLTAYCNNYFLR